MKTAEEILNETPRDVISVSPQQTIHEALDLMVANRIGAMLVREGEAVVGIWTERDFMRNALKPGFDARTARIGDFMTDRLHTAPHDATVLALQEMFLGLFIRHIVVEKAGRFIGLLSVGDILRANLLEKDRQIRELNSLAGWEYYENWRWGREKKKKR